MAIFKHVVTGSGAAGDIWTSGLHSRMVVEDAGAAHAAWEAALEIMLGAAGIGSYWADTTGSTNCTTYTLDQATGHATWAVRSNAVHVGTGGAGQPAPRDCIVVGLRTAVPGPAGRGRMYLPAVSTDNLSATGLISDAAKTAISNAVGSALLSLQTASVLPGIWRVGLGDAVTGFRTVTVSGVQGTQRRRSNKIPAAYTSNTF
jgi:hypothetical protein